jgi:exopolyphosphatase/pppGpp-phosphohydrolase
MSKKAVIDIGSLKMKVAIFDAAKRQLLSSESYLTLLGKSIDEHHEVIAESLEKLEDALRTVAGNLKKRRIREVVIIGTEALRRARNISAIQTLIAHYFPNHELNVVEQAKEAELFFQAVSREFPDQHIVAADVGGGSVQIIEGKYDTKSKETIVDQKYHLATGTYRLQQQYSPRNDVISDKLPEAHDHVMRAYKEVKTSAPILVFGSSCMLDFVVSSGIATARDTSNQTHPFYIDKSQIVALLEELKALAPDSRIHYYPAGGYFMHGADYLLMNVLAAAEQATPERIYPTNLNSSYAFI